MWPLWKAPTHHTVWIGFLFPTPVRGLLFMGPPSHPLGSQTVRGLGTTWLAARSSTRPGHSDRGTFRTPVTLPAGRWISQLHLVPQERSGDGGGVRGLPPIHPALPTGSWLLLIFLVSLLFCLFRKLYSWNHTICRFSGWLLSLGKLRLSFFHVFSWLDNSLIFSSG